jgi:hypothetical protein
MSTETQSSFDEAAQKQSQSSFLGELWQFLRFNKKWWLIPIVVLLLIMGLMIALSGSAVAPFIYTLF